MKGEMPVAATGLGGRQVRVDPMYGNIYDHFSIIFEYAGGQKLFCSDAFSCFTCQGDPCLAISSMKGADRNRSTDGGAITPCPPTPPPQHPGFARSP